MAEENPFIDKGTAEFDEITARHRAAFGAELDVVLNGVSSAVREVATNFLKCTASHEAPKRPWSYDTIRWSDRGELSPELELDLAELHAHLPLSRHNWLQEIIDQNPKEQRRLNPVDVTRSLLTRMKELAALSKRGLELEAATVEMGFRFTCSCDENGNPFSFVWVRSPEIYERREIGGGGVTSRYAPPVRSDLVGIGGIYATYKLGKNMGYEGTDAQRWFIAYRAEGILADVPFDSVAQVVDGSQEYSVREDGSKRHYGSVLESPSDRKAMFHDWIEREVA